MKGKIFYKNLILVVLIFILCINSFVFADDVNTESTTENSIDNKDGVYYLGEKGEEEEVPLKVTPGHLYLPEVSGVNMNPQLAYNWGLNQYKNDDMNGFMGFYKNFIIDLGGIKISFYDNATGKLMCSKYVLSKQFQGSDKVDTTKKLIENEDTVILVGNAPYTVDISFCDFSNNIPLLSYYNDRYSYCKFSLWEGYKLFDEWKQDPVNLEKLVEDIGLKEWEELKDVAVNDWIKQGHSIIMEPFTYYPVSNQEIYTNQSKYKEAYDFNYGVIGFSKVLKQAYLELTANSSAQGYTDEEKARAENISTRSIFYHCGYLNILDAGSMILTNGEPVETRQKKNYLFKFGDKYEDIVADPTASVGWLELIKTGIVENCQELVSYDASHLAEKGYVMVAGHEMPEKYSKLVHDGVKAGLEALEKVYMSDAELIAGIVGNTAEGNLTNFTDEYLKGKIEVTIKNAVLREIKVGTDIFEKSVLSEKKYEDLKDAFTEEEWQAIQKEIDKILKECIEATVLTQIHNHETDIFESINKGTDWILEQLIKLFPSIAEKYEIKKDELGYYYEETLVTTKAYFNPLTYTETTKYNRNWVDEVTNLNLPFTNLKIFAYVSHISKTSLIFTDHNKYSVVVPVSEEEGIKTVQQNLSAAGLLLTTPENNIYKYGAALICSDGKLGDEILIKFHSNLEQISDSTGSIDPEYNLYAQIGSSEYTWQKDGTKVTKFPFTYPQDIASAYKNDEGESYEYSSYGTIIQKSDTLFPHRVVGVDL